MMAATSVYTPQPTPEMALVVGSANVVAAATAPHHGYVAAPPEATMVSNTAGGVGGGAQVNDPVASYRPRADTDEQSSISLQLHSAASPYHPHVEGGDSPLNPAHRPVMPESAPSELTLDSSLDVIGAGIASELASARIKEGLCPTCGTRLYKFRRTVTRKPGGVSFVKRMLDKTIRGRTASADIGVGGGGATTALTAALGTGGGLGGGPEENEGDDHQNHILLSTTHLPAPATSGGVLASVPGNAIPLTIEGEVVRGQCVKCSGAGAAAAAASMGGAGNGISPLEGGVQASPEQHTTTTATITTGASSQNPASETDASPALSGSSTPPPMAESYTLVPAAVACTYEGQKDESGRFHGYGELRWDNGDRYVGMFWNGLRDGEGSLFFGDGTEYVGEWRLNKMCGAGTRRYANGNVFTGHYRAGRRHGQGRLYYTNGDLYDGEWRDDEIHGFGRFHYNTGRKFEGNFRNGKREGRGKYQYADGRVDIYRYQADRHVGQGVRWSKDRKKAWRLLDGKCKERVPLEAAARIAEQCGRVVDYET